VVIVGTWRQAHNWARQHAIHRYMIADRPQCLIGLPAKHVHVIVLPDWRKLRQFHLLQMEVWLLERNGATVEAL
jgi:hypothetical protein